MSDTTVALSHGYPPAWNMGGEVALHRMMTAVGYPGAVLTQTAFPYELDGVHVFPIQAANVFDMNTDPAPIAEQLQSLEARLVIAQNELTSPAVKAARMLGVPSLISMHTPPKYGSTTRAAILAADAAVYNTRASAIEWGEPDALVLHPPISPLPELPLPPTGDAYTLLSSLSHKGAELVLELARMMPQQRFIMVESPASHMEPENLRARLAGVPNIELMPRVTPDLVPTMYFSQTRILLVPSRYETYGMSAIEAAGYGIPSIHVDTPHVREGIGAAAYLVPPLNMHGVQEGIYTLERNYEQWSQGARARAEELAIRQQHELAQWTLYAAGVRALSLAEQNDRRSILLNRAPNAFGVYDEIYRPPMPAPYGR